MVNELTAGLVRILDSTGATVGTGFVVTDEGLIATCAHLVQGAGAGSGDTVRIAFHATGEEHEAQVELAWWRSPDSEDVAILRLDVPLPEGVTPLLLGNSADVVGHALTTFGFPAAKPVEGMAGLCEVVGRTTERGFSVLQLRSSEIAPGFSGAPVLDTVNRRVVGMVTAITIPDQYGRLTETAFITPTEILRAICPVLQLSDLCPYRGLAVFTEAHAEFFFGREALVADLVDHLRGNPRFLAVVGPSGSGKSSVVRAGLFPALHRGEVPGSADWHLLTFRPGNDPFAALTTAGLDTSQEGDLSVAVRAFLETHLQVKRLVLFADQFEELFAHSSQSVQEQFLHQLTVLLESNLPVTVVLTLRADFYGHLIRHRPLVDWLKVGQVNILPMGPEELRAAVKEPAKRLGLRFEPPGLVKTIVEEAGEAEYPLPLLESALTQLWEKRTDGRLTHAAYQAVGRVTGAIGQWAEDAYTKLLPEEQSLAQRAFTRLVRYGEGVVADTRQRQSLSALVTRPEEREPMHRLVRRLADARLLVTGGHAGSETVEIIHDALLQQWGRLKHWIAEQGEFYQWRQRLDQRLREWEEERRDKGALLRGTLLDEAERWLAERTEELNEAEREFILESLALRRQEQAARALRRRWFTLAVVGSAVVFLVLALLAWGQRNTARTEVNARATAQAQAEERRLEAEVAQATAIVEAQVRATAQMQAEEHRREAESAQATAIVEAQVRATAQAVAEDQRRIALARQLAAQAQINLDNTAIGLVRSTLLGVESMRRFPSLEADQALRRGLDLLLRPMVEMSHHNLIYAVAFSSDGRWLATGSRDNTARIWDCITGQEVARMTHESTVQAIAFSPDGHWLATGSRDNMVRVWEVETGADEAQLMHRGMVMAVAFSPDGQWLATGSADNTVRIWEVETWQEIDRLAHGGNVLTLAFSPDGNLLATGSADNTARVWNATTWQEMASVTHDHFVESVVFSPNGQWLATESQGAAWMWDVTSGHKIVKITNEDRVEAMAFSPDGNRLVTGNWDNTARVWDTDTWQEIAQLEHRLIVNTVAFSPDGRWLVTASLDNTARVWDTITWQEVARMPHKLVVDAAIFNPNGRWIATTSGDHTVQIWDLETSQIIPRMAHEDDVGAIAFSPDGQWLATGGWDGTARVWNPATKEEVARIVHEGWVDTLVFSSDGQWLATMGWDDVVLVWDMFNRQEAARIAHKDDGDVLGLVFSSDGRWLATKGQDSIWVWDTATWQEVKQIAGGQEAIFSPDGRWLATSGEGNTTRVWDTTVWQEMKQIAGGQGAIFSPDGRWLATGGEDNTARVWDTTTWQELAQMVHEGDDDVSVWAHSLDGQWLATRGQGSIRVWDTATWQKLAQITQEESIWARSISPDGRWLAARIAGADVYVWDMTTGQEVARISHNGSDAGAFSPNGNWLATGGWDGIARVWNPATGQEIARMVHEDGAVDRAVHEGVAVVVAFSPDGRWLVTGSADDTVRMWLWRPEDLIAEACTRLPRNLTREEWQTYLPDDPYRPTCPNLPVPEE